MVDGRDKLIDQMRTCAAAITASQSNGNFDMKLLSGDVARLLTEAAEIIARGEIEIIAKSEIDLLDVQQDPPLAEIGALMPRLTTRHFDDGSKHCLVRGNDAQAMRSIGRQR